LAPRPFSPPVVLFLAQSSTGSFFSPVVLFLKQQWETFFSALGL
jgi:hypothetical protein